MRMGASISSLDNFDPSVSDIEKSRRYQMAFVLNVRFALWIQKRMKPFGHLAVESNSFIADACW